MAWEVYRGRHELAESRRQTGDKKELHPYFVPSEWQIQQIKQHNTTQMLVTVLKQHTQVAIKKHLIFQAFYSKLLKNIVDSDKKKIKIKYVSVVLNPQVYCCNISICSMIINCLNGKLVYQPCFTLLTTQSVIWWLDEASIVASPILSHCMQLKTQ